MKKDLLNGGIVRFDVRAPLISKKAKPGQFIMFCVDAEGERVPLTIADTDPEKGFVTIIFNPVGCSTMKLADLEVGDRIKDFVGPLGMPTHVENVKNVCVIGGGVGCAIAFPQAKYLHSIGTKVDIIAGFRNKDIVILEEEMKENSTNLYLTTDDGSYGEKGFVTDKLKSLIEGGEKYDLVIAIGPVPMMKFVSLLTKEYNIKTLVSLNPIMIDGTGMCGGCRVSVGGEIKFACVDGPDFDGHEVDFDELMRRNTLFKKEEESEKEHQCRITGEKAGTKKPYKTNLATKKLPMPEQDGNVRNKNFKEVSLGYTEEMAIEEAQRCLDCKHKPCVSGCPVNVRIPEFITQVAVGNFEEAYYILKSTNALPAVCGRVCPQETQCEEVCVRGKKGEPVAIGRLERFVADWFMSNMSEKISDVELNGKKVAVVGAGPSGLTCSGDLAKLGYEVTVFEAFHEPGGVLTYGIPEFRLPKAIVKKEIDNLKALGVKIELNMVIGKLLTLEELFEMGYDAIYIASGAGLPRFMGIEGEGLVGVYSANEFLTRVNLMKAYKENYNTPIKNSKAVAVVGGGNVAMDAARCAKRVGAENVYIVYRRSREEMPSRLEEIHHAEEEGIELQLLTNPLRIIGDEEGRVTGMECIKMELGEPDESGRRRPTPIEGSNFILKLDSVIMSIGTSPNPLIPRTTKNMDINKKGCIVVDDNMRSTKDNVYAGGDAVVGAATVIYAMGCGKEAAKTIHEDLNK
ncbi:MAG: bifunctional dihydroorotate dehydrogenase B NAD binding subunit/NADPH-dependent glutamate synthase [Lachnospirales bacterium]